jgi:hypothetical protein
VLLSAALIKQKGKNWNHFADKIAEGFDKEKRIKAEAQ